MPLPLLAAVAGNAAGVFSYNRANFLHDSGQRVQRYYTGLSYQMQLFNLYRQDIRDLVGLTTEKMTNYHVVACLELGMICTLLGPARLPSTVPEWVLWHQLTCLCAAFAFLVASMWLATRAVVVAGSFNVRLQTQYIRLPLPDDEMLDEALTKADDFEGRDLGGMLRIPFLRTLWQKVSPWAPAEAAADPEAGDVTRDVPRSTAVQADHNSHLRLYQHLQKKWACYDAYARVTMSMGTYWLIMSMAYYEIGWVLCNQGKGLPAIVAASLFTGILILLIYLDVFVGRVELILVAGLIVAGPALVASGASVREADEVPWQAVAAGVAHALLACWLWHAGTLVPGKTDLPAKFKGVSYLDIFGPIVQELQKVLDRTGIAFGGAQNKRPVSLKDAKAQLQSTLEGQAVSDRNEARNLSKAVQDARRAGVSPKDEHLQAAERALERVALPKEMQNLRRVLADWKASEVWNHFDGGQQALVDRMSADLDFMLRRLPASAGAARRSRSAERAPPGGRPGLRRAMSEDSMAEVAPDAREMAFGDACVLCDRLMARADKVVVGNPRGPAHLARQTSSVSFSSSQFVGDDFGGDDRKKHRRQGHHPVVAFRALSAGLATVWLIGAVVHVFHHPTVRSSMPWASEDAEIEATGGRRLSSSPALDAAVPFRWPARFFQPRGAFVCGDNQASTASSLHVVASNGFVVHAFHLPSDASAAPRGQRLGCPVDVHDAMVSSDCAGTSCGAVVAAEGKLWRCGSRAMVARRLGAAGKPMASLPVEYIEAHGAPTAWATADANASTLFAAPRHGRVVKLRREGGALRPVATLPTPAGVPPDAEWEALAALRGGRVLVGLATPGQGAPGPTTAVAWDVVRSRHLATWSLPVASDVRAWCADAGGRGAALYGVRAPSEGIGPGSNVWELFGLPLAEI